MKKETTRMALALSYDITTFSDLKPKKTLLGLIRIEKHSTDPISLLLSKITLA